MKKNMRVENGVKIFEFYDKKIDKQYREHVYFIHAPRSRLVKIGRTINMERRFSELSNTIPEPIYWKYGFEMFPVRFERYLHNFFNDYCFRGEWFEEKVLALLKKEIKNFNGDFLYKVFSMDYRSEIFKIQNERMYNPLKTSMRRLNKE